MDTAPHPFRRYIVVFATTLLLSSPPLVANLLFLKHAHEIDPMSDIVRLQQNNSGVYGSALVENTFLYKLELVRQRKPDIVLVGSSKVMAVQETAFNASFINAGGSMKALNEGALFVSQMMPLHQPKILLIGLDYFWFNTSHPRPFSYPEHDYSESDITREKILAPFQWLLAGKISASRYWRTVTGFDLSNAYTTYPPIGFMAINVSNGFRPDGSRFYGSRYVDEDPQFIDAGFGFTGGNLAQRCCEFERGSGVDASRLEELRSILRLCDQNHVRVVLFLTPTAPSIYKTMRQAPGDFAYMDELDQILRQLAKNGGYEYYDFRDLSKLGSNDCESVDGTHGGNTAYLRIFRSLAKNHPTSILHPLLNTAAMDQQIAQFSGKALALRDTSPLKFKEKDFLHLGCSKD